MIDKYFAQIGAPTTADAWQHIYRLLLWIDWTTGLTHCYESDKSQPGRPWYSRSLAFHGWVASEFGVAPAELAREIDFLFRRATYDLALVVVHRQEARALQQRADFEGRGFPEPGEDPELMAIIEETLAPYLTKSPSTEVRQLLVQRIRQHMTQENKRKNLVGEGFEDVLAAIIRRSVPGPDIDVSVRHPLDELPGFRAMQTGEKRKKVDLALIREAKNRIIVTAKWSIRGISSKRRGRTSVDRTAQAA